MKPLDAKLGKRFVIHTLPSGNVVGYLPGQRYMMGISPGKEQAIYLRGPIHAKDREVVEKVLRGKGVVVLKKRLSKANNIEKEIKNTLQAGEIIEAPKIIGFRRFADGKSELYLSKVKGAPLSQIHYNNVDELEKKQILRDIAHLARELHDGKIVRDKKIKSMMHGDFKLKNIMRWASREAWHLQPIDFENSFFSRRPLNPKQRCFDLLTFIGDAVHYKLIETRADVSVLVRHYFFEDAKTMEDKKFNYVRYTWLMAKSIIGLGVVEKAELKTQAKYYADALRVFEKVKELQTEANLHKKNTVIWNAAKFLRNEFRRY